MDVGAGAGGVGDGVGVGVGNGDGVDDGWWMGSWSESASALVLVGDSVGANNIRGGITGAGQLLLCGAVADARVTANHWRRNSLTKQCWHQTETGGGRGGAWWSSS